MSSNTPVKLIKVISRDKLDDRQYIRCLDEEGFQR